MIYETRYVCITLSIATLKRDPSRCTDTLFNLSMPPDLPNLVALTSTPKLITTVPEQFLPFNDSPYLGGYLAYSCTYDLTYAVLFQTLNRGRGYYLSSKTLSRP
jgi:hypothetical protein